jgi:hypothetical protein
MADKSCRLKLIEWESAGIERMNWGISKRRNCRKLQKGPQKRKMVAPLQEGLGVVGFRCREDP